MPRAARLSLPLIALLALALLGASLLAGARPAEAQSWTCDYSFSSGLPTGWSLGSGSITGGGIQSAYVSGYYLAVVYWPAQTTLTSVTVTFNRSSWFYANYGGDLLTYAEDTSSGTFTRSGSGSSAGGQWFLAANSSSAMYIVSANMAGTGTNPCPATATPTSAPTNTPTPIPPTATQTLTPTPTNLRLGDPIEVTFESGLCENGAAQGTTWHLNHSDYVGCNWNNTVGQTSYTVPIGNYLVGWLTRVTLNEMTGPHGGADLRSLLGSSGAAGARVFEGELRDNMSCVASPSVPANTVPNYAGAGLCAAYPAYTTAYTASSVYYAGGQSVTLGGLSGGGVADPGSSGYTSTTGKLVVFELIPVLYTEYEEPTVDITCPEDATVGIAATFEETHENIVTGWLWEFNDANNNTSTEADGDVEYTYYDDGPVTVELTVSGPGGTATDSCTFTVYRIGQPRADGSGALYRPLLTMDSDTGLIWPNTQLGLFSAAAAWGGDTWWSTTLPDFNNFGPDDETVIGVSNGADTQVYAVADGTILDVQPLAIGACDPLEVSGGGGSTCAFSLYSDDVQGNLFPFAQMGVNPFGLYKVTVSYVTGIVLEYYVANAPQYVRTGQELLAGCILGETTAYTYSTFSILDGYQPPEPERTGGSMFWMQAVQLSGGAQVPILAQLYTDPDPATACNAGGEYSDCLFDPMFTNQGGYTWEIQGGVSQGDGFTLEPGASISLNGLNLDAATAYGFTVWTERPRTYGPTDARITLGIGTTETSFFLDESIRTPWTIAPATHTADQGSLYSIRILNSGRAPFTVLQNCVSNGEPNTAPASCYFQNYTFDGQLTNWTITGTIVPSPAGAGALVVMSDLATIGQNVRLYADGGGGDHEYTVRLEGVLNGVDNSSMITVRYRYGGGGWTTPSVAGWTRSQQNFGATNRFYVLEFDVPSGNFAGLMEFQFDFTAAGTDVIGTSLGLNLLSLCLQDAGGFSHHPGGGGSNWTPGTGCDNSAPPAELQDDFGAWIAYHLDGMEDIYYCDVIPQLERLNNITYGIYEYAQWSGLYSQAAQANMLQWADKQLFPWFGGYLSNIANAAGGRITVDPGGGCHDLFCLLDAVIQSIIGPIVDLVGRIIDTILSLINTAANLLIPLIEAIIGFFVTIINGLSGILNSLITLITAFISGIANAQPAPVPGLPNCAIDPSSNAICAVMYGLEQTVFSDEGSAIIPLFIAILSIAYLQWFIGKITELIAEVTDRI
jgi:hypothetical protein